MDNSSLFQKNQGQSLKDSTITVLDIALTYLRSGISLVAETHKTPQEGWNQYKKVAPSEAQLKEWFSQKQDLAVLTGKISNNLHCLDIDKKNDNAHKQNDICIRFEQALNKRKSGLFLKLVIEQTPSGGLHLFFRCKRIEKTRDLACLLHPHPNKIEKTIYKPIIELFGEGGSGKVTCYPTKGYFLRNLSLPETQEITEAELDILLEVAETFDEQPKQIYKPKENRELKKEYKGLSPWEDYDKRGDALSLLYTHGWEKIGGNGSLLYLRRPGKEEKESSATWNPPTAPNCLYVWSHATVFPQGKAYSPSAIFTFLECNGDFKAAAKRLAEAGYGEKIKFSNTLKPIESSEEANSPILQSLEEEENGDAKLFAKRVEGRKLYDHTALKWLSYKNGVWVKDEEKKTRKEAISLLTNAYLDLSLKLDKEIVQLFKNLQEIENKEEKEAISKNLNAKKALRDTLRKRAKQLTNRRRIDNVLDLATGELPTLTKHFDKDPYHFNLANGIFDFKQMAFITHSEEERFYKQANVSYEPEARCEKWIAWLNQIFNQDQHLIQFIQQFVGISLTGLTDLQVLFFCYGKGANGKTTFFSVLKLLLGDYYTTIPIETLLMKQRDSTVDYQLAKLHGARLVVASEIPEGRRLQESQVKDLTGGEPVNARNPHEKPFTFEPSHKVCLFGNHKPIIRGTDHGIWRRIQLIPFTITIPKSEQKPRSKLLEEFKQELSGILNWAIQGYTDYLKNGLKTSQAVESATREYQEESDTLGSYLNERCEINPIFYCFTKDLFVDYLKWCQETNETSMFRTSKVFVSALRERDFKTKVGHSHKTEVLGLKLKNG